ncbi:hypothetical protein NLI96_g9006 [Meripilus lineatus]|uniref:Mid2 domain-containing protein n=1 Tax=Meripilus lineatus TaxID=2056292 RepID=A0AAD5YFP0_9APHY|nr:hypothetical protein NLI96_g9006 [Physisporinus lineatus]
MTPTPITTDHVTTLISTSFIPVMPSSIDSPWEGTPSSVPSLVSTSFSSLVSQQSTKVYPLPNPITPTISSASKVESSAGLQTGQTSAPSSTSISTTSATSNSTLPATSTTEKTKLGTPAITGIVVAAFLGLVASMVVLCLYRRRRQPHVEIDDGYIPGVTPFENPQRSDNSSADPTSSHPSFQTGDKRIMTVTNVSQPGAHEAYRTQYGRGLQQPLMSYGDVINPALDGMNGLAHDPTSMSELDPPTYTQF